jgi:phage tail-like protein
VVWILGAGGTLIAVETDGRWRATFALGLVAALGLAVTPSGIYVGDAQDRRLWRFDRSLFGAGAESYERVGAARGYRGPVAGLAVDRRGALWLAPGCGLAPLVLDPGAAFVERGVLWGGPISDGDPISDRRARCWQRLAPVGHGLDDSALHLQWFFAASDDAASPPPDPDLDQALPFDPGSWTALAPDVADVWIGAESRVLWLGALIEGDGSASVTLANLRLERDREGYLPHLPAIYQTRTEDLDGLLRFLGLFESFFVDAEGTIDRLERLFDPWVAPVEWLPWLAAWLAVDLDEAWPEPTKREVLASAWERHRWRGTARGLRSALRIYAGLEGLVEEPILGSAWWALAPEGTGSESALAEASVLGFSTRLAASEPAGAVLGSSAVLDQSRLLTGDEYGAALFDATAHQLTVRVHRRQLSDLEHLERVRRVVEREKPAHTHAHLCVIEPRLRVGFQARLGVDSVIGGGAREAGLLGVDRSAGSAAEGGVLVLGGEAPGRLGEGSRVGQTTRLGAQPVEPGTQCPSDERRIHGRPPGP